MNLHLNPKAFNELIMAYVISPRTLSLLGFGCQIIKERIEGGANEKAVFAFAITTLSFASISIFPG